MGDVFDRAHNMGPLGKWNAVGDGYFLFPELEGELGPRMKFNGKEMIIWSSNNYLGLGNHPEVRKADAEAAERWGLAYPMGSRIMSGETKYHKQLEQELATFVGHDAGYLLNFGYQGVMSIVDAMLSRNDVVVYDRDNHACIYDGLRMHLGKRVPFEHNDVESFTKQIERGRKLADESGGGLLVVTEGVFGMRGELGILKEIVELKEKFNFRILIDDAHGFGSIGPGGRGAAAELGVMEHIDLYFATFAKSMALIGAFVSGEEDIIRYLRYHMRSQVYAKSLPMAIVQGALKRLDMIRKHPEFKDKLWENTHALQKGLKDNGFDIGNTGANVTPVYLKGSLEEAGVMVRDLRETHGIFCSPVVYPVVPRDVILLRLIPTAVHTQAEIDETIAAFREVREKLDNGTYKKMAEAFAAEAAKAEVAAKAAATATAEGK